MAEAKILKRLKRQLRDQGHDREAAHEIAMAALQACGNLRKDGTATVKGKYRGNQSAAWRAADRAHKYAAGKTVTNSRR